LIRSVDVKVYNIKLLMVEPSKTQDGSNQPHRSGVSNSGAKPEGLTYSQFKLDERLCPEARERLKNPKLHPLIAKICCGFIIKEDDLLCLGKAGQGGFGDVFLVDENFVVKRVV
jgi:hypothetical protein